MILWQNREVFPPGLKQDLTSELQQQRFFVPQLGIFTTYDQCIDAELNKQVINFYDPLIQKITGDLNLFYRCSYTWNCWFQYYAQPSSHHEPHDHFQGDAILSWVHFIKTSRHSCFRFFKNQKAEEIQEEHDDVLIVFPAWALHAVLPNLEEGETRLIAAGNINLQMLSKGSTGTHISRLIDNNTILWSRVG